MKHKVAELEGGLLDAAVALALTDADGTPGLLAQYSRFWEDGGPIIDRERIGTSFEAATGLWHAEFEHSARADGQQRTFASGPTLLIAALRAFVASKLGEEVELP